MKPPRGFAKLDPETRKKIASAGGKMAHRLGTAHEWTSEEASAAGAIGGAKSRGVPKTRKPA
jgi:hypothetical protein